MSDANWTPATTQQAIALWVGGKDVAEIAREFGVAPGEVLSRIAQAAIAGEDAPKARPADATTAKPTPIKSCTSKSSDGEAAAPKSTAVKTTGPKTLAPKAPASRTVKAETAAASEGSSADDPATTSRSMRTLAVRPAEETPSSDRAAGKPAPARASVAPPSRPVAEAVPDASAPVPLRLVPPPSALAVVAASDAAPAVARGYEAVALPAPVRTAKRLLVAADGGAGVPFMTATTLDCHFPLWADTETVSIERKRVCGCRALAGKSWCAHHLSAVFEPPRKPQPRVA